MSDTYKTKCPNCHAVYKVGIQQLASGYKRARCKRCKHQFVMRDNLVTESLIAKNNAVNQAKATTIKPPPNHAEPTSSATKTNSPTHSYDDNLIHDDMKVSPSDDVAEFKQIQEEWSDNPLRQQALTDKHKRSSLYDDTNDDENWLGNLLKQNQSDADQSESTFNTNSFDNYSVDDDDETLNDLLDELGVDTDDPSTPDHEQSIRRMQQRLESKSIGTDKRNKKYLPTMILWLFGCLVLIMLLPAQYILFNLDHLAKNPEHRAKVESLCGIGICTVPGTDLTKFAIPKKTFRTNPNNANQTDIIATLVNTDTQAQLYPTLKVSIYDQSGLMGDFIAEPKDYLTVPQRLMSANKIELFMLSVDLPAQNIHRIDISPLY